MDIKGINTPLEEFLGQELSAEAIKVKGCQQIAADIKHGSFFATRETTKEAYDYALMLMVAEGMSEYHATTALAVLCNTIADQIKQVTK